MKTLIMSLVFLFVGNVFAADVTIQWDANTELDLAGYKIYYDNDSGVPYVGEIAIQGRSPIIVPVADLDANNPEITLNGFDDSKDYYFAITAYDNETPSLESDHSDEVMLLAKYIPSDGPPTKPNLREVFWKRLQAFWNWIKGNKAKASWS